MIRIHNDCKLFNANAGSVPQLDSRIVQDSCSSSIGGQSQLASSEDEQSEFRALLYFVTDLIFRNTDIAKHIW